MNADICGASFPANDDAIPMYRCGLASAHDGVDHRDWGVLETPGQVTSWVFTWETEVTGHRIAEWAYEIQSPKNWWQHLLMQLGLPHRQVRRYATITSKRLYPDLPVLPENKAGVSFYVEDVDVIADHWRTR